MVGNTSYYIGRLSKSVGSTVDSVGMFGPLGGLRDHLLSVPFVSGVAISAGILLTVIVIVCVAYHRKSLENDRVMRRMQCQMDGLEARVANECKEGLGYLSISKHRLTASLKPPIN